MEIVKHNGSDWGGSVISTFQSCKRKHYWGREYPHPSGQRGLQLISPKGGTAADFGNVIHIGLQHYYVHRSLPDSTKPRTEICAEAMLEAVNSISEDLPGKELVRDEVLSCLDQYFSHYENEDIKVNGVEEAINVQIGDYIHTGYIDLVGEWNGQVCIVDHKTTSLDWERFFKKWRDVLSLKGYVYAHWKTHGELVHILINGIRRKKNKAMDCEFQRDIISYTTDDMLEFEKTVLFERKLMEQCRVDQFWPKSGDRCVEVWGECEFRRLCTFYSESMVKTFYQPREAKS